ncbi:hypothetical protein QFZ76_004123 [Streptomyces sp. V4I2]|nr:hypothetical protein [Streptomyces sp. V4I2]
MPPHSCKRLCRRGKDINETRQAGQLSGGDSRLGLIVRLGPVQYVIRVLAPGSGPVQQVRDQLNCGLLKENRLTVSFDSHDGVILAVPLQRTTSPLGTDTGVVLVWGQRAADLAYSPCPLRTR